MTDGLPRAAALAALAILTACEAPPSGEGDPCDAPGALCVVAGQLGQAGRGADGLPATATSLYLPQDVAVAGDGAWWIVDYNNHVIREVDGDGVSRVILGSGFPGGGDGGPALDEPLDHPTQVLPDPLDPDVLWVAATGNHRVGRLARAEGQVTFPYGTGEAAFGGDGGPASLASFHRPSSLAFDADGAMYVSDRMNQVVRRVGPDGVISTVVGAPGEPGDGGDGGPATAAHLHAPASTEMDPGNRLDVRGTLLVLADTGNDAVRAVDLTVGTLERRLDGLTRPHDVALAPDGTIYVADTGAACVRALRPDGQVTVVAGRCGTPGPAVAVTDALDATLDFPCGIFVDEQGFLWIADTHNHVIRRVGLGPP